MMSSWNHRRMASGAPNRRRKTGVMVVRSRIDSLQFNTMLRTAGMGGLLWDGGSGVFHPDELRGDFFQGWRDDLGLFEARHDQRRDAGPLDQGGGATGSAGGAEIPR